MTNITQITPKRHKSKNNDLERIYVLDVLRGLTLFGILVIHSFNDFTTIREESMDASLLSPQDRILDIAISNLFSKVLYSIFSFLFGLSFAIQMNSAISKGQSFSGRFLWRLTVLLMIGYVHSLFFPRDILQLYALLGMALILVKDLSPSRLLWLSLILFGLSIGISFFNADIEKEVVHLASKTREFIVVQFLGLSKLDYLVLSGRLFTVFSLFILGLYAGKRGLFNKNPENSVFFTKLMYWSFGTTLVVGGIYLYLKHTFEVPGKYVEAVFSIERMTQSIFYVSLLVYLYRFKILKRFFDMLIPVGKMGLTVYVTQSFFLIWLYAKDPAEILDFGLVGVMAVTTGFFLIQLTFAWVWMSIFRFGPLEWLWRSATFLQVIPILRR
ncbi:MAG: DUF418 domain-containing protein [Lunatimonas sp.]|uniref:DUF418 domain-containing protein n=1 Tax=Lunatimonas sp. TaxID=2060141 RepID=UPI00263AA154|nr:DUF418 domain-containing protein [Lunatimonas sp.]MCC5938914.1 DUF418 domain-containing protein [Lunatimonas sp.]